MYKTYIDHYKAFRKNNPDLWLKYFKQNNFISLNQCIDMAASALDSEGRKHPHQYRIPKKTLEYFGKNIKNSLKNLNLNEFNNFEELYDVIEECKVPGIGYLTIYDTVLRIAKYQGNLDPKKYIYIHAGSLKGIKKILKSSFSENKIKKSTLPQELFQYKLTSQEYEDFFCFYNTCHS